FAAARTSDDRYEPSVLNQPIEREGLTLAAEKEFSIVEEERTKGWERLFGRRRPLFHQVEDLVELAVLEKNLHELGAFVRGRRRAGDQASESELLLAPERLPIFQPVRLRPHPDFRGVRPAQSDGVAIHKQIVVVAAGFGVRTGRWNLDFHGTPAERLDDGARIVFVGAVIGEIDLELVVRRRLRRPPGRGFGEILEQEFDEFAQDVAIDLVGRNLVIEALQNLERIALDRGAGQLIRGVPNLGRPNDPAKGGPRWVCALGRPLAREPELQLDDRVEFIVVRNESALLANEVYGNLSLLERGLDVVANGRVSGDGGIDLGYDDVAL